MPLCHCDSVVCFLSEYLGGDIDGRAGDIDGGEGERDKGKGGKRWMGGVENRWRCGGK